MITELNAVTENQVGDDVRAGHVIGQILHGSIAQAEPENGVEGEQREDDRSDRYKGGRGALELHRHSRRSLALLAEAQRRGGAHRGR